MANFTVYNTSPEGLYLPYYMTTGTGGLNTSILGNTPQGEGIGITGADVLNNCVGWCQGRMMEVYNEVNGTQNNPTNPFTGCSVDAQLWYANYNQWGMTRQATPAVGAIGCYRKRISIHPTVYEGHVLFVERYNTDTGLWEASEGHYWYDGSQNTDGSWDYTTLDRNNSYKPLFLVSDPFWQKQGFLIPNYGVLTLIPSVPIARPTSGGDILIGAYRKRNRRRFY